MNLDDEKFVKEHKEKTHQPPTRPFAKPMTDEEVEEKRIGNTLKRTQEDKEYCL